MWLITVESLSINKNTHIASEYQDFPSLFSAYETSALPPHCPWDCAIDILPDIKFPHGCYTLSQPEQKTIEEYVLEGLRQGYIALEITWFTKLDVQSAYNLIFVCKCNK